MGLVCLTKNTYTTDESVILAMHTYDKLQAIDVLESVLKKIKGENLGSRDVVLEVKMSNGEKVIDIFEFYD